MGESESALSQPSGEPSSPPPAAHCAESCCRRAAEAPRALTLARYRLHAAADGLTCRACHSHAGAHRDAQRQSVSRRLISASKAGDANRGRRSEGARMSTCMRMRTAWVKPSLRSRLQRSRALLPGFYALRAADFSLKRWTHRSVFFA